MSYLWGEQLRAFRLKAGYETLAQLADALSALEEPVYLDSSTLSRYENEPSRMPKQRERHLLLAEALVKGGGIESIAELNGWLAMGGLGHLTPEEEERLFSQATVTLAAQPEADKEQTVTAVVSSLPSQIPSARIYFGIGILVAVIAFLFLGSYIASPSPSSPATGNLLVNNDFEEAIPAPWTNNPECRPPILTVTQADEKNEAYVGKHFVTASTFFGDPCRSFFQDIAHSPALSDTYTFSIWGRSPTHAPLQGVIGLWARHDDRAAQGASMPFLIAGSGWHCLSVQLTITQTNATELRPEVYLDTINGTPYQFDHAQLSLQSQSPCPTRPLALENPSFEEIPLVYWQAHNCEQNILDTAVDLDPVDGERYLVVQRPIGAGCISFYQDTYRLLDVEQTYRYSIWVRGGADTSQTGEIALWAEGGGMSDKNSTKFVTFPDAWQCVEVVLPITQSGHTRLRSEVYMPENGQTYYFDNAQLSTSSQSHCPLADLFPGQVTITGAGPFYAGSSVAVMAEVRNGGVQSISDHTTRLWVAEQENGNPLDTAVQTTIRHNTLLLPNENLPLRADVRIPLFLYQAPGEYYLVIEVDSDDQLTEANEQNNRYSVPLTITACGAETVFCDVPLDHWGRAEIELWYALGITRSCNQSGTEYQSLPFCPNEAVLRDILAVVIMRHLQGGQYRPEDPYEGLFTDVKPDDSLTPWIEALAREDIVLTSDACPTTAVEPLFCPKQVVTKGDLVRYLAEILAWELPATADGTFVDVTGSSVEARAITYMAQQGYLDDGAVDCVTEKEGERAFCADEAVTRGHTAVLMVRAFGWHLTPVEP